LERVESSSNDGGLTLSTINVDINDRRSTLPALQEVLTKKFKFFVLKLFLPDKKIKMEQSLGIVDIDVDTSSSWNFFWTLPASY
jgi:hypothetical protein